ncbi:helix-turn-helix domain-containing protein [bacterium]|nr:MAG: helix-turn-helix domain-containing protein [bacterium]MCL4231392.1 helix-turn-helix domain-containing protein [Dehalococcoidia bacterium]
MAGIGETLRNARNSRGLTIEQAAQDTRISPRFLEALEEEQFDALPAPVYVRGFLRSYANYLRLDATPLLAWLQDGGPPVAGPDAFVGGPRPAPSEDEPSRPDPFRPALRSVPPPIPPAPPVPPVISDESVVDEEGWSPEAPAAYVEGPPPEAPAGEPLEENGYPPEEPVFRPRRVAGVLSEREPYVREGGNPVRFLAFAGVVLIVVLVGAITALALMGGDDDSSAPAAGETESPTPTRVAGTVIPVNSPTAASKASPSPAASASPSPTGTPASPSPSPASATKTPPATAAPSEPTATPTETPIPTPTATLVPPTPTSTPLPPAPSSFGECSASSDPSMPYDCGPWPYVVVCHPNGWFIDRNGDFPLQPGWTSVSAGGPSFGDAIKAGKAGCQ